MSEVKLTKSGKPDRRCKANKETKLETELKEVNEKVIQPQEEDEYIEEYDEEELNPSDDVLGEKS